MLTSAQCLAIIKEREMKKRLESREKEQRKREKRSSDSAPTPTKRLRLQDELNDNVCSISFGTYQDDVDQETGRDWAQCPYGRCTHDDCVEDSVTDVDGKERFCLVATVTDINLFGIPYYAVYSILNSSQIYGG